MVFVKIILGELFRPAFGIIPETADPEPEDRFKPG